MAQFEKWVTLWLIEHWLEMKIFGYLYILDFESGGSKPSSTQRACRTEGRVSSLWIRWIFLWVRGWKYFLLEREGAIFFRVRGKFCFFTCFHMYLVNHQAHHDFPKYFCFSSLLLILLLSFLFIHLFLCCLLFFFIEISFDYFPWSSWS